MGDTVVKPGIYIRYAPQAAPTPVLIDVSRSGREYPHDFRSPLPFTDLHDNVSMYVEDLYAIGPSLGASSAVRLLSEYVCRYQPQRRRYRRDVD